VRARIATPLVRLLKPRLIGGRLRKGPVRALATTALHVCVSSPITGAIGAALFTNPDDFASVYVTALATTMPMTMFASFFIIGPAVKLVCHNRIKPASGLRALQAMEHCATPVARFLGM